MVNNFTSVKDKSYKKSTIKPKSKPSNKRIKAKKPTDRVVLNEIYFKSNFVRPDDVPFWQFLKSNKIPFSKKHFPFLTNNVTPKIKQVFDFSEYIEIGSRGEALSYLYNGFGKALNYVGPVLDLELEHGFNDHTDRHTLWVSQTGVELLQRAGVSYNGKGHYDPLTESMMTLVGMTHDLGNFFSRKEHSTYSAWLLSRLFSNTQKHPKEFKMALHAILFHEEPTLINLGMNIEQGTPLQWALVAADKMHVGRDRVGGRSFESGIAHGAFEDDIHIVLNSLIVRSSWHLGVRKFIWNLDFSVDQLEEKFESFTTGNQRLYLPKLFQNLFINKGTLYRESFVTLFNDIYKNRMHLAAKCVFLLFPHINEFVVELSDNDTRFKVGSGKMVVLRLSRRDVFG
jgi:hypothetical protein